MTKEFKDIALEFTNNSITDAINEQAFLKNVFTKILNNRSEETTDESSKELAEVTFNLLMKNWSVVSDFTNVEQLNVFLREHVPHFVSVVEEENDLFLLAVVIILKTIACNYLPPVHHVYLFNSFRIQAAVDPEHASEIEMFLTTLWANLLFVNTLRDFEIYAGRKWFNCMWTVITVQNNELETIRVNIPKNVTQFPKEITYSEKTDNLIIEINSFREEVLKSVNTDIDETAVVRDDVQLSTCD